VPGYRAEGDDSGVNPLRLTNPRWGSSGGRIARFKTKTRDIIKDNPI
jgi:hypothetical protein